jgi:Arc/MetJ-type ribon-helix-helix transcriptional regulator
MNADVDVVRLQAKDSALIDHFIKVGEFRSKSEFITYAVKKAVNEFILRELEEKSRAALPMAEKDVDILLTEIQDIRKKLWEGYAHRVF